MNKNRRGLSLMEVLVSLFIVVAAISALATIYPGIFTGVNMDMQSLKAWEICQKNLETLKNASSDQYYWNDVLWLMALLPEIPSLPPIPITLYSDSNTRCIFYVSKLRDKNNQIVDDLLVVEVVVCHRSGRRVIGEDANLNGLLNSGEDTNGDKKISSPVTLKTLVLKSS